METKRKLNMRNGGLQMKKYSIEAVRTDTYIVEIDESIWTPEELEKWGSVFFDMDSTKELAEHVAFVVMRGGYEKFSEGFGYLYTQDGDGRQLRQWAMNEKGVLAEVTDFSPGIKVTIISQDEEYNFETEETEG